MHTVLKATAVFTTLVLSGALAASAAAQPAPKPWNPSPSITASLDIGGSGNFTGVIENQKLCYMINAAGVANPTVAEIQANGKNGDGAVVLNLKPPVGGASADCVPIAADVAGKLVKNADDYRFTLKSAQYPDGVAWAPLQGQNG
jgi:hypothetical protein